MQITTVEYSEYARFVESCISRFRRYEGFWRSGRGACRTLAQQTTPQAACLTSQAVLQSFSMAIHSGVPKAGMFQHDAQARCTTWHIGIP
jgi:hypothetical protein